MSKIPIFLASNDNYAPFLCTTMYSVLEHTQSFIEFHILDGGIEEENKNLIEQSLKKFENYSIKYYDMSSFDLERFPNVKHYSLNTFSRYFIPALAPNIEKLIYIDIDVIVNGDISELYNIDLEGKALAAVPENFYKLNGEYVKEHIISDFENTENYFNAGVMLLNNKQFVENNYSTKLINMTIELFDKLSCPDQDVYNIMFEHNHKLIDYKFNYMPGHYDYYKTIMPLKELNNIKDNAIIYHYTCGKPWKNKRENQSNLFWRILSKTKFEKQVKETHKDDLKASKLSIFSKLFCYKEETNHKIYKILGIKFKFRKRKNS